MAPFPSLLMSAFFLVLALSTCSTTSNSLNYPPLMEVQDRQVDYHKIPTSCSDLTSIGRRETGLHLIKAGNGINVVFCDFSKTVNTAGYETAIGLTDVKSGPVYFYGQRNTEYFTDIADKITVNYDAETANIGGGFNKNTGIFTAPKEGKYFFLFSAVVRKRISPATTIVVNLRKKDEIVASTACSLTSSAIPLNLQTTLVLKAGDTISITALCSNCLLNGEAYTTFSGRLVEENISSKLETL